VGNIDKFNLIADSYDTEERKQISGYITKKIVSELDLEGKVLLDFGCGTGLVSLPMADKLKRLELYDASEKMSLKVNEKIKNSSLSNAAVVSLDSIKKVDLILLVQVLLHEKEIEPLVDQLYRLLNSEGKLVIVDFDLLETDNENLLVHPGFNQEKLSDSLKKLGFEKIKNENFYKGKKNFMNSDAEMFIMIADKHSHS
jgi:2-polyprenyl-3-methyl-5-hydroxy-6-metoxy-1,4-benzoquinol methylase